MNIVDVFLIFAISVVSIELSSQDKGLPNLREIGRDDEEYREFQNNVRNRRNEQPTRILGGIEGHDDPNTRTFRGNFSGHEDDVLQAMIHVFNRVNVSRVFLQASNGQLYGVEFHDPRAPFQVELLGRNLKPDNIERRTFTTDHDPRRGEVPFYSPGMRTWIEMMRAERVIIKTPDGSKHHYNIIWPRSEESSSSTTVSSRTNQENRERKKEKKEETEKEKKEERKKEKKEEAEKPVKERETRSSKGEKGEIISGFKYKRMFDSTSKPSSSAGPSSSQTVEPSSLAEPSSIQSGHRRRKGKEKVEKEEEEEEEEEKTERDSKGKKIEGTSLNFRFDRLFPKGNKRPK